MNSKSFIFLFAAFLLICSAVMAKIPNDESRLEVATGTNQVNDAKYLLPCVHCCGHFRDGSCSLCCNDESHSLKTEAMAKEEGSNQVDDTKDVGHGGGHYGGGSSGKGGGDKGHGGN
ncbi:uncharacterized protein LOC111993264 isoform X1 [Quercus suber]|uniref:uncharacterized protein LOC111993264 isoform X1 n=1 Tax=Quercus suber TaxID=58331 RepID=UPI000CE20762|nr:uncharacterized protein LOC111993264 isoform X2 [Quercus suber]